MNCQKCNKDEETIRIAGSLYCAGCGTILEDSGEKLEIKTPEIKPIPEKVRTEIPPPPTASVKPEIEDLAKETKIKSHNIEELGGSGVLLDILSTNAKELETKDKLKAQEDLLTASTQALDETYKANGYKVPKSSKPMHDIVKPKEKGKESKDYLQNLFDKTLDEAQKIEEKEVEEIKEKIGNEKGYTRLNVDFFLTTLTILATIALTWVVLKLAFY